MFSATEFNQLLKLPWLFQHYTEHKEEHKDLSFLNFLTIHYLSGNKKYADYDKDMKLPFKSHDSCENSNHVVFAPISFSGFVAKIYTISENMQNTYCDTFYSSAHLSSIWQPPKNC